MNVHYNITLQRYRALGELCEEHHAMAIHLAALPRYYGVAQVSFFVQCTEFLQTLLQRFCNTLSPTCIAMHHMPNSCAKHPIPYLCYTDPDDLPSFADQCSFGNWSSDSTPEKMHRVLQNAFTKLTRVRMSSSQSVQRCQVCILLAVHCCPWLAVRLSSMTAPSFPVTKRHPSNGTHLDCSCSKVRFGLLIVVLHVAFTCTRYQ